MPRCQQRSLQGSSQARPNPAVRVSRRPYCVCVAPQAGMLGEAGFRHVSHTSLTGGVVAIHSGIKINDSDGSSAH